MPIANPDTYLTGLSYELRLHWPSNHLVNIVCHGHSVPAGYFATPFVDTFNAYPHLLHRALKSRFPYAVLNVIVTAIGGENSASGADRFAKEVLCHHPRVVTIDYGLNDRGIGIEAAEAAWRAMIEQALAQDCRVILLTPTPDTTQRDPADPQGEPLRQHATQIRRLADEYAIGLADSLATFEHTIANGVYLTNLLAWANHPNREGHELVVKEIARWFPA